MRVLTLAMLTLAFLQAHGVSELTRCMLEAEIEQFCLELVLSCNKLFNGQAAEAFPILSFSWLSPPL